MGIGQVLDGGLGQTLKGDLWTNLGVWTVDKPWYLASVQVPVSGLWNSLSWWPVDRPWYLAHG